ncbi:MAG: hypothetical protein Q8L34_00595 [Candidatus Woesearchaeota archaeon]|nr:hypothetical protein [Candidatus Woesearchaeota archaeon]
MGKGITAIQKIAWFYAALFLLVVILGYIPGVEDENGLMFGLFEIDPIDDGLHLASALWAALAAWHSIGYTVFYFRTFGILYCLDGIVGIIAGKGFLDFAIFMQGPGIVDMSTRIAANIPHIVIGGLAIIIGFVLKNKLTK